MKKLIYIDTDVNGTNAKQLNYCIGALKMN